MVFLAENKNLLWHNAKTGFFDRLRAAFFDAALLFYSTLLSASTILIFFSEK